MKHTFRKILTVAAALILALPVLLFAACKTVEPRSEADVIPETLGEAEGLWLYRGNTRSRTDGTEKETLLTSVTVDDTEYSEEEFKIVTYQYVRDTHEIFYVLIIGKQYRAYHYNYLTKESSDLCALSIEERQYDYRIAVSSSLVYIYNTSTANSPIFSPTAQLLYENFEGGTLDGDIVYRVSNDAFTYFKDGVMHQVQLDMSFKSSDYHRYGKYVYFFGASAYGINLETEEYFPFTAINAIGKVYFSDIYCKEGVYYFMTVNYIARDDETKHVTRLFKASGETAQLIYEFGDAPHGMRMGIDGDQIYITQYGSRPRQTKYFVYATNTGKINTAPRSSAEKGKTPEVLKREEEAAKREENLKAELSVGEFTFYVTSIGYDDEPGMFGGSFYTKTCYYLMRDYNGKSEVLQYSLNENRGYFYDDIQEF